MRPQRPVAVGHADQHRQERENDLLIAYEAQHALLEGMHGSLFLATNCVDGETLTVRTLPAGSDLRGEAGLRFLRLVRRLEGDDRWVHQIASLGLARGWSEVRTLRATIAVLAWAYEDLLQMKIDAAPVAPFWVVKDKASDA